MTKELEALEKIKNISIRNGLYEYEGECFEVYRDELATIESALKEADKIKHEYQIYKDFWWNRNNLTDKYTKVVMLIKEKRVDTYFLMQVDTLEEYNNSLHTSTFFPNFALTQEEFDLLKEVLL